MGSECNICTPEGHVVATHVFPWGRYELTSQGKFTASQAGRAGCAGIESLPCGRWVRPQTEYSKREKKKQDRETSPQPHTQGTAGETLTCPPSVLGYSHCSSTHRNLPTEADDTPGSGLCLRGVCHFEGCEGVFGSEHKAGF